MAPRSQRQPQLNFGKRFSSQMDSLPEIEVETDVDLESQNEQSDAKLQGSQLLSQTQSHASTPLSRPLSRDSKRTSWVYNHMVDKDPETRYRNKKGHLEWRCAYCPDGIYKIEAGTASITRHLGDKHAVQKGAPRDGIIVKNNQTSMEQALALAEGQIHKRRRLNPIGVTIPEHIELDGNVVEVLLVKLLSACSLPLRIVECQEFQDFVTYLNHDINQYLPRSHHTIRTWVMRQRDEMKQRVMEDIHNARSKIHISCDIWTSPNDLPIIGFIATYVTSNNHLRRRTLALKEIQGDHSGLNLSGVTMEVLQDWQLISNLGYFMMDNASNNDTMIKHLSRGK
jgi:hypothetical protein